MKKSYLVGYIPRGMNRREPVLSTAHDAIKSVPVASVRRGSTHYANFDHKQAYELCDLTATGVDGQEDEDIAIPPPPLPK